MNKSIQIKSTGYQYERINDFFLFQSNFENDSVNIVAMSIYLHRI